MTASLSAIPKWQVLDGNGIPISGAMLETYIVSTSTPAPLYTSYAGTEVAPWPLVFDEAGTAEVWLNPATIYKMILKDADGVVQWEVNGVQGSGSGGSGVMLTVNTVVGSTNSMKSLVSGSALFVQCLGYRAIGDLGGGTFWYNPSATDDDGGMVIMGTDAPATGRYVRLFTGGVSPRFFGAYGNGITSDTAYFSAANTYAAANGLAIYVPSGSFLLSSNPNLTVVVEFSPTGKIIYSAFSPNIDPIISDLTQHFILTAAIDYPKFPAGTVSRPEWFGALGDNVDDTIPVQAAVLSCVNGGKVQLSDGTFVVGEDAPSQATLTLVNNIEIAGKGKSSILKFKNSLATNYGLLGSAPGVDTENVRLHDFAVDGNRAGGTQTGGIGVKLYGRNSVLSNLFVHDCSSVGIFLGQVADTTGLSEITNCTANRNKTGISVNGLVNSRVVNNDVYNKTDTDQTGLLITDCATTLIDGNRLDGTGGVGIYEVAPCDTTYGINFIAGYATDLHETATRYVSMTDSFKSAWHGDNTSKNTLIVEKKIYVGDTTTAGYLLLDSSSPVDATTWTWQAQLDVKGDATVRQNMVVRNNLRVDGTTTINYMDNLEVDSLHVNKIERQSVGSRPDQTAISVENGLLIRPPDQTANDATVFYPLQFGLNTTEAVQLCCIDMTYTSAAAGYRKLFTIPSNSMVISSQMNNETTITFTGGANMVSLGVDPTQGWTPPGDTDKYGSAIGTKNTKSVALYGATPNETVLAYEWNIANKSAEDVYVSPTNGAGATAVGTFTGTIRVRLMYWHVPSLGNSSY